MKKISSLLMILGFAGTAYFGWEFYQSYTNVSVLGAEVSFWDEEDLVPLLVSIIVLLIGAWLRKR